MVQKEDILIREIKYNNIVISKDSVRRASKYINLTGNDNIDYYSILALENLRVAIISGIKNDIAKYCLPECFKVDLVWTINMRSLMNFLQLRLSNNAHFEIRELANRVLEVLPKEHLYLYEKFTKGDK